MDYNYAKRVGDKINCCSDSIVKVINADGTYFYEKQTKCKSLNQAVLKKVEE